MIPRLTQTSISFQASESKSPRDTYTSQMVKNSQTAQKQNRAVANMTSSQAVNQIPMQGVGQKLDVIA